MDLSVAAFTAIAERSLGVIHARFERLGDASVSSSCVDHPMYQQRIMRDVRFQRGVPHQMRIGDTLTLVANRWFVVRGITYPDGTFTRMQDFVGPKDKFTFTPSQAGHYVFLFGAVDDRRREMQMEAVACGI